MAVPILNRIIRRRNELPRTGLVALWTFVRRNLLNDSEAPGSSLWTKLNSTIDTATTTTTTYQGRTITLTKFTNNSAGDGGGAIHSTLIMTSPGGEWTGSFITKNIDATSCGIALVNANGGTTYAYARYNFGTGAWQIITGAAVITDYGAESLGDGVVRLHLTAKDLPAGFNHRAYFGYATGTKSIYLGGMQWNAGKVAAYERTTDGQRLSDTSVSTNLLHTDTDFTSSFWLKAGVTATSDTITEDTSTGLHYLYQTHDWVAGRDYHVTARVTRTAGTRSHVRIQLSGGTAAWGGNGGPRVDLNLNDGTFTTSSTVLGLVVESLGAGDYRVSFRATCIASTASVSAQVLLGDGTNFSYTGAAGNTLRVRDFMLSNSGGAYQRGPYTGVLGATAGSDATDPAWGADRLDFDGAGDYVSLGTAPASTGQDTFVFVLPPGRSGASSCVYSQGTSAAGAGHFFIYRNQSTTNELTFTSATASTLAYHTLGTAGVDYKTGDLIGITADYTARTLQVFVNGVLRLTQNFPVGTLVPPALPARLGVTVGGSFPLLGSLHYFSRYSVAWTPAEHARAYRALKRELASRPLPVVI